MGVDFVNKWLCTEGTGAAHRSATKHHHSCWGSNWLGRQSYYSRLHQRSMILTASFNRCQLAYWWHQLCHCRLISVLQKLLLACSHVSSGSNNTVSCRWHVKLNSLKLVMCGMDNLLQFRFRSTSNISIRIWFGVRIFWFGSKNTLSYDFHNINYLKDKQLLMNKRLDIVFQVFFGVLICLSVITTLPAMLHCVFRL